MRANSRSKLIVLAVALVVVLALYSALNLSGIFGKKDLADYARSKGLPDSVADNLKGVEESEEGKQLVDLAAEAVKTYGGDERLIQQIAAAFKAYAEDGRISSDEVASFKNLDADGDGLPILGDNSEHSLGGLPWRKDKVLAKALSEGLKGSEKIWEVIAKLNEATNGKLTPDAQKIVEAAAASKAVRDDPRYVEALSRAFLQDLSKATQVAVDTDLDGIPNSLELKLFDKEAIFKANPVVAYAYTRGLNVEDKELLNILLPLENDGKLDTNDAEFVDALAENQNSIEKLSKFLLYVSKDGIIDGNEAVAVPIILTHPVIITGLSGKYAVGEQTYNFGHTLSKSGIKVSFGDEAYRVAIIFVSDNPDFAKGHPYASYGLIKDAMILIGHIRYGIAAIMNPLKDVSYGKVYKWSGDKFSVRSIVNKQVENINSTPKVAQRLTADYVLENAGDAETADIRIMTATLPTYALHWCDFEKRMYFFEVLPRDVAWDGLPRLWLAWRNVNYWPELHRIAERVLAGNEIDPDTGKPYTSVESLKLRFRIFGPKTQADMLKLATQGSEMAKAAFPLYHWAIYNHHIGAEEYSDGFRVELYRALMWGDGLPSYRAGNIDHTGAGHGEPGIPLAPSDIAMFDEHLVVEPLTKVSPYHPFRSDEPWGKVFYGKSYTVKSDIQYPWYEVVVFRTYEVPASG